MPCQNITTCHLNAEDIKDKAYWIKLFDHDDSKILILIGPKVFDYESKHYLTKKSGVHICIILHL